jgi:Cu/Ag efflux protein CusF
MSRSTIRAAALAACSTYAMALLMAPTGAAAAMNATAPAARSVAGEEKPPLLLTQAQQAEPAKLFRGGGYVTAVDGATGSLVINHEAIEGLMPAMEMMFRVDPRALSNGVRPGDRLEFGLEGKTYTIRDLKVVGHVD